MGDYFRFVAVAHCYVWASFHYFAARQRICHSNYFSLLVVPLAIFGSLLNLDFVLQRSHWILEICMHGLNWLANLPTWQQAAPPMWTLFIAMFGVLWMLLPRGFPQRWLGLILLLPLFFVRNSKA